MNKTKKKRRDQLKRWSFVVHLEDMRQELFPQVLVGTSKQAKEQARLLENQLLRFRRNVVKVEAKAGEIVSPVMRDEIERLNESIQRLSRASGWLAEQWVTKKDPPADVKEALSSSWEFARSTDEMTQEPASGLVTPQGEPVENVLSSHTSQI